MDTQRHPGFTIIEVMLFLAISGALAVGILIGSNVAITSQRYRDSLNSLQSLLQQQYNQTDHVINDRAKDRNCTDGVINETTLTPEARGTSECVIIGKYTTIKDGTVVTSSTVVGELKAGKSIDTANNDLEALQMYNLGISAVDNETSPVAWSATVFEPNVSDPANVAILLLRSPLTGSIRTFVGPIPAENVSVATLVDQQNTAEKKLCIESGSPLAGPRLGVLIKANAAGSSAIELLGDDGGC